MLTINSALVVLSRLKVGLCIYNSFVYNNIKHSVYGIYVDATHYKTIFTTIHFPSNFTLNIFMMIMKVFKTLAVCVLFRN